MKLMKNKLPYFKSAKEEAKFWDKHSVTDYLEQLAEVDDLFVLSPALAKKVRERSRKRLISIRLANWEIEKSKEIAQKKHCPYQTLIRTWVDEGLRREILTR